MLYENLSNDLRLRDAATKVARRTCEIIVGACAAGVVGTWNALRLTRPELGPEWTVVACIVGIGLLGVALIWWWQPPAFLVERMARHLPKTERRMLSRAAVVGIALSSLAFVFYAGPHFVVSSQPPPQATLAEWQTHVSQSGGIAFDVRGDVTETAQVVPSPAGVVSVHTVATRRSSVVFIAQWADAPNSITNVERAYDNARDSEPAGRSGQRPDEQSVKWLGYSAREVRFVTNSTVLLVRYLAVGPRLYAAKVIFPEDKPALDDATRFFSSWRLNPRPPG